MICCGIIFVSAGLICAKVSVLFTVWYINVWTPLSGNNDGLIFIDSNRKLIKLLHIKDEDLVLYVKCLEAGRFKVPSYDENSTNPVAPLPNLLLPLICTLFPPAVFMIVL